ncbi:hypothetical protein [Calditerricola satsumensis]|uniref:Uncharacterized protein n=1 Tax=Calditerricola satsumensis TaxID=373054 RepID=A0A8J3B5V6_9BACI|nr:hypothetical protein [Calditerricola satsumensis]GGJ97701.1 hypothetical protein GCM10007043_09480 [Calditerricola satsumensis]
MGLEKLIMHNVVRLYIAKRVIKMNVEEVWFELKEILKTRRFIPTLKEQATAEVLEITDDAIIIRLKKGVERKMEKSYFYKAIDILKKNGRVRQQNLQHIDTARYVLGALTLLPYFVKIREFDATEGKHKWFVKFAK